MFSSKPKFIPGVPYEVQRIYDMLSPKPKELLHNASGRTFITEGEVGVFNHKERRTKRRHIFLFNDILLVTKKEGKKSHWLKIFIALRSSLKIEDVPDSATRHKVEFRIYAPKKTIILFTQTNEEKVRWLRDIRACIAGPDGKEDDIQFKDTYSSTPEPVVVADVLATKESEPEEEKISGDIGKIEIPGFESDNTFGTIPEENDDSSEEESPVLNVQGVDILNDKALPPTPHSTPVAPSMLEDDFDSLVNRNVNQSQTPAIPQQAAFDFFAAEPQPFATSAPLTPSGISPSSSSVLQPTPANATPSFGTTPMTPLQPATSSKMEGFAALKSLDTQTQTQNTPQQFNFSQGLSIEEQMQQLSMQSPYYNGN